MRKRSRKNLPEIIYEAGFNWCILQLDTFTIFQVDCTMSNDQ